MFEDDIARGKIENHINEVRKALNFFISHLMARVVFHDESKLKSPEFKMYSKYIPVMEKQQYGSEEYKKTLEDLRPALLHHYHENWHHPEHYSNGISGMTVVDLVEMIADWIVASSQHKDGDPYKSLEINRKRFDIDKQLYSILYNSIGMIRGRLETGMEFVWKR